MKGFWKLILFFVLLSGGGVWYWWSHAPYDIVNEHPTGSTIIALGDSLTVGYGASPEGCFANLLSERLGVPILNKGVLGDTSADALERLSTDVLANDPRIVIVCLGGNDLLGKVKDEIVFANLRDIVDRIQDRGALVILVGMGGSLLRPGFASQYEKLARQTGSAFVPDILSGIFGHPAYMYDQIHPNGKGYAMMADRIEPVLRKYVE